MNAYAERFVGSVRRESPSRLVPLGDRNLRRAMVEFIGHYNTGYALRREAKCAGIRAHSVRGDGLRRPTPAAGDLSAPGRHRVIEVVRGDLTQQLPKNRQLQWQIVRSS